ncbi:MAG: rRNA maturation RNase YbeY [Verrucomicrobia bacterium]|jgi:probable rRNA maturation factor|nr:rRNA maturation RNase YbeY [Verrucomicrobiota bacterium]
MSLTLTLRNRQRTRAVAMHLLRHIIRCLLTDLLAIQTADLGVFIVAAPEMARLNERFLGHAGATDVITFDYADAAAVHPGPELHGEIFVCLDEAVAQARRFRTSWPAELVRYVVHGVLHLRGYTDQVPADRRRMKREEDRLLRALARSFVLSRLASRR